MKSRRQPQRPLAGALLASIFLAGCALGPDYTRPTADSPDAFRFDRAPAKSTSSELEWWLVYQDETLQRLLREALAKNYDLRVAAARVEQARAIAQQARSQFFPGVTHSGIVNRGRNDVLGSPVADNEATVSSGAAALNAIWEVDLWGRVRRLNESARAQFLASEEAQHGVQLSLISDVATAYFQLLELDEELKIATHTTDTFEESLRIFNRRLEDGTASGLESARAQAALDDAAAALPSIRRRIAATENQLSTLLGRTPGPIQRSNAALQKEVFPEIPAGMPSALLERRPDIRQSEQFLRSANAQIGQSTANFFPKIGLTALLGKVSPELSGFTLGSANAWGVAVEETGPLFQGGRLAAQYRQANAARDEAGLRYKETILNAFREVSDALVAREQLAEICELQIHQVGALEQAVKLSSERYLAGKASYYEVLEAQQQRFPAQLNLARTQRDQLLAGIALYKALGGGWQKDGLPSAGAAVSSEKN